MKKVMKRLVMFTPLFIFVVLGMFLFWGLNNDPTKLPSALLGKPMPKFELATLLNSDELKAEKDLVGNVSLLNVWATWCISCRVEHPYLMDIAKEGVHIFGVNYKDQRKEAVDWLGEFGNPYVFSLYDENGRLGLDLGVYGAPETYILDGQGVIQYKHVGVIDQRVWLEVLKPIVDQLKQQPVLAQGN